MTEREVMAQLAAALSNIATYSECQCDLACGSGGPRHAPGCDRSACTIVHVRRCVYGIATAAIAAYRALLPTTDGPAPSGEPRAFLRSSEDSACGFCGAPPSKHEASK